jgi:hypothetical protein
MKELDFRQLASSKIERIVEKGLRKISPNFEQVMKTVLRAVDLKEISDVPTANTPEELFSQTRLLLEAKGKLTKPTHGRMHIVTPDERDFLRLPYVKINIADREANMYLEEISHSKSSSAEKEEDGYYFGISVKIGHCTMQMIQGLTIDKSGVSFSNGKTLDVDNAIQRISRILTKADNAIPPKIQ